MNELDTGRRRQLASGIYGSKKTRSFTTRYICVEGSLLLLTTQDTYLLPKYVIPTTMYIDIGTHAIYLFLT